MGEATVADGTYEQFKSALKAISGGRGRSVDAEPTWSCCGRTRINLHRHGPRPVPRQQLSQTRARPALGQTIDDVGEIGVRIESVEPSRFDNRVYVRRPQATFVAAQEEKILPRHSDGPQSSFRGIVIDSQTAVAGIAGQRLPTAEAVLECLADRALQG